MGRGRAKAKQTKVARELKYREFNTDFSELQRELHGDDEPDASPGPSATVSPMTTIPTPTCTASRRPTLTGLAGLESARARRPDAG